MPIAIMAAMHEEIAALFPHVERAREHVAGKRVYLRGSLFGREVIVVHARWGKVAAAATAAHAIGALGAREVVFTGVAGAVDRSLRIGDVVVARDLYQHDLDASPIFPPLHIPLLDAAAIAASEGLSGRLLAAARAYVAEDLRADVPAGVMREFGITSPRVVHGDIASGDQFFSSAEQLAQLRRRVPTAAAVEMEGAAVAQVCHEHGVEFAVVRTISDAADEDAPRDFPRFLTRVASHYSLGIIRRLLEG